VWVAFVAESPGEDVVEFRAAAGEPASSGGQGDQPEVQVGVDYLVGGCPGLGEDPTVGVDHHGIAGAYLVVVASDPVACWENRHIDPAAIEREFRGPNGRAWLMRWLPARAHDNGMFVIFSNGVGRDDDEVRTGNAMVVDPTVGSSPRPGQPPTR